MAFKWTVEIEVDAMWVADGFNLTADRVEQMMLSVLRYAQSHEIKCRIIKAPSDKNIAKVQGFDSVAAMKAAK